MSYRVEKQDPNTFVVIEGDTGLTIDAFRSEQKARDVCRNLNLGSGFQGWTPTFFCNETKKGS